MDLQVRVEARAIGKHDLCVELNLVGRDRPKLIRKLDLSCCRNRRWGSELRMLVQTLPGPLATP